MNILIQICVVLLGLLSGALLLIALGLLPYWQSLDSTMFKTVFSNNTPHIAGMMMPLGFSATGFTLLAAGFAVWKKQPGHLWMIAAAVFALCMFVTFPTYFRGANEALAAGTMSSRELAEELLRWQSIHWIRTASAILAGVCAMRALYARIPE